MSDIQTFRSKLLLGKIIYTVEVKSISPLLAKAKLQYLEKVIRNGVEKDIVMSDPKYVKK